MRDLNASLSSYGLSSDSKLLMIATQDPSLGLLETVQDHIGSALLPLVDQHATLVQSFLSQPSNTRKQVDQSHLKVSELLLQSLLKMDGIECTSDDARQKRRELIKFIQSLLDRIDLLKSQVDALVPSL